MKNLHIKSLLVVLLIWAANISQTAAQTVYITKTGKKYHKSTCRYLSKSSYAISLSDAKTQGYGACSVCRPTSGDSNDYKTPSVQCNGITQKGHQCKRTTNDLGGYCWQHQVPKIENKTNYTKPPNNSTSIRCSAYTQAGSRCKRMTKNANGQCWQHQ